MLWPENSSATKAYDFLAERLVDPANLDFFVDNPEWNEYIEAAHAVLAFALERPTLLVNNATDKSILLDYLSGEWEEADKERGVDNEKLFVELGDVGFFALLTGMVYWDELEADEQSSLVNELRAAELETEKIGRNLSDAITYVAEIKDPINYPSIFLQVFDEEDAGSVPSRLDLVGGYLRMIRHALNGEWKESGDIFETLLDYYINALNSNLNPNTYPFSRLIVTHV